LTKKRIGNKISEPFRFFRGQKKDRLKIYLPTKHTKRPENFKDEDRLGRVPSAEESILLLLLVSFRVFRGQKREDSIPERRIRYQPLVTP